MSNCNYENCAGISSRTWIEDLKEHYNKPGISRCYSSCGSIACGCILPMEGCLYSRTVAEKSSEDIYEVTMCQGWDSSVSLYIKEIFHNGARISEKINVRPQETKQVGSVNITVNFVVSQPIPILSSIFLKKININGTENKIEQSSRAVAIQQAQLAEVPLRCKRPMDFENCILMNTCSCNPTPKENKCSCRNLNISATMLSLEHRLSITTADVAIQVKNGEIKAVDHRAIIEINIEGDMKFHSSVIEKENCEIKVGILQGCFNCIQGAKVLVTCSSIQPTIATISCERQTFAVRCGVPGKGNLSVFTTSKSNFEEDCKVSCGKNIEIKGSLLLTTSMIETAPQDEARSLQNFWKINFPEIGSIWTKLQEWWKTTLFALVAPALAGAVILVGCPTLFLLITRRTKKKLF